jgi:hypothetical protein
MKATANRATTTLENGAPLTPVADGAPGSNLDQLRDIIFGGQMREYEKRFARMEERLAKEVNDLREEVRQRCATLERYARDELQSATERITATSELASKQHRELRAQLLEQTQTLTDDTQRRATELRSMVDRETARLRDEKADRTALSDLMLELALRLRGESVVPGQE